MYYVQKFGKKPYIKDYKNKYKRQQNLQKNLKNNSLQSKLKSKYQQYQRSISGIVPTDPRKIDLSTLHGLKTLLVTSGHQLRQKTDSERLKEYKLKFRKSFSYNLGVDTKDRRCVDFFNNLQDTYKRFSVYYALRPGQHYYLNKLFRKSLRQHLFVERGYERKPWQVRPRFFPFSRPLLSIFRGSFKTRASLNLNKLYRQKLHNIYDFIYMFDIHEKYKKVRFKTPFYFRKLNFAAMRSFYGIFHHRKYVKLLKKKSKSDHFQSFLFSLMERRLDVILFRCCFARSIYSAQQMVRSGWVTVNNNVVRNFFYPIKFYDHVSFVSDALKYKMQYIYFLQLSSRRMQFPKLPYITINFNFMFFFVHPFLDATQCVPLPYKVDHHILSSK